MESGYLEASAITADGSNRSALQNASNWSTVMGVLPCNARDTVDAAKPTFRASSVCVIDDSCIWANRMLASARFRTPGTSARYRRRSTADSRLRRIPYMEDHLDLLPLGANPPTPVSPTKWSPPMALTSNSTLAEAIEEALRSETSLVELIIRAVGVRAHRA